MAHDVGSCVSGASSRCDRSETALTDIWHSLTQSIVDDAVDEWRKGLQACMNEKRTF